MNNLMSSTGGSEGRKELEVDHVVVVKPVGGKHRAAEVKRCGLPGKNMAGRRAVEILSVDRISQLIR